MILVYCAGCLANIAMRGDSLQPLLLFSALWLFCYCLVLPQFYPLPAFVDLYPVPTAVVDILPQLPAHCSIIPTGLLITLALRVVLFCLPDLPFGPAHFLFGLLHVYPCLPVKLLFTVTTVPAHHPTAPPAC